MELAEAIASPANPLTARVIVNRVWQQHFGYGIVRTPSNLARRATGPRIPNCSTISPAGLCAKAGRSRNSIAKSCSPRPMRLAMKSPAHNFAEDPDNRLLWRYNRRRLDAESLRDSLLFVSGKLDLQTGGPAVRLDKENNRRTVYGYISRRQLDPMLALFDFPNPNNTASSACKPPYRCRNCSS